MTEILKLILAIAGPICALLTAILSVIVTLTKNKKVKKDCDDLITILFKVENKIIEAEKFINWTGEEKKQYVLSMLQNEIANTGITNDLVDTLIENFIYFSKQVNNKKEDENGKQSTE